MEAFNQQRYVRVYNWKCYIILGYSNNCIRTNFLDDVTDEWEYKHNNRNIVDGNVMNISLIVM